MTALHYASLSGSESTVKVLVKQKNELTLSTNVSCNRSKLSYHYPQILISAFQSSEEMPSSCLEDLQ